MTPVKNKQLNCDNIQLYVEDFIDQVYKNPHFTNDKICGAPPKVINDLFTDGFSPPAFRKIIKNLGTTDMNTTIELLPDIYTELDNYLRWKQIFDCPDEDPITTPPKDFSGCSFCYPNNPHLAQFHTDDNCFILHPEKRHAMRKQGNEPLKPSKVAHNATKTKAQTEAPATKTKAQEDADTIMELQNTISFLTALQDQGDQDEDA